MNKVFIAYVKEDFELVSKLVEDLEANGIEVFWDENIKPGQFWEDEIKKGINEGNFFIACFSKEYHEKKESYMNTELSIAIDRILKISRSVWFIPVKLNETTIPKIEIDKRRDLTSIQAIDLSKKWDLGIKSIVNVIVPKDSELEILNYNSESDGIYTLWDWPYSDGLIDPNKLQTTINKEQNPLPDYLDKETFKKHKLDFEKKGWAGLNYYLTDIRKFDEYGEMDGSIKLTLAPSEYTDFLSIRKMMQEDSSLLYKVNELVKNNPEEYILNNPLPTHVNTNIVVLNNKCTKFLASFRGNRVTTANMMWVVSINETMRNQTTKYEGDNNFFDSMHRGLEEELGLERKHYSKIILSWLGIVPPRFGLHCIGIVKLKVSEAEAIIRKNKFAKDAYEHQGLEWYPFNLGIISDFFRDRRLDQDSSKDNYIEINGGVLGNKRWLHHVPICLREAWRMKDQLQSI